MGPNHKHGCNGNTWQYSGDGYNRVKVCACGAEDHAPDIHVAFSPSSAVCCRKHAGQFITWMQCCNTCGNKRCPKATNCGLDCTNSNDAGQPGSAYE